jgi:hypothetical protein
MGHDVELILDSSRAILQLILRAYLIGGLHCTKPSSSSAVMNWAPRAARTRGVSGTG